MAKNRPKQKTDKGLEIPVPKGREFDAAMGSSLHQQVVNALTRKTRLRERSE